MKMDKKIKDRVQEFMDSIGVHFASHSGAGYCYITRNGFDYSRVSSFPVSIDEAWEDGNISIREDGNIQCDNYVIPMTWDAVKIRRRCEDALRKRSDVGTLLKIADILSVPLL